MGEKSPQAPVSAVHMETAQNDSMGKEQLPDLNINPEISKSVPDDIEKNASAAVNILVDAAEQT